MDGGFDPGLEFGVVGFVLPGCSGSDLLINADGEAEGDRVSSSLFVLALKFGLGVAGLLIARPRLFYGVFGGPRSAHDENQDFEQFIIVALHGRKF